MSSCISEWYRVIDKTIRLIKREGKHKTCAIICSTSQRHREASVDMSPIVLKPRDISTEPGNIDVCDTYQMMLSVNFASQADAQELYDYLGLVAETATYISTSYPNILNCPQERISLPLKAAGKQLCDVRGGCVWGGARDGPCGGRIHTCLCGED